MTENKAARARNKRLAAQLRENLRRRKRQARDRSESGSGPDDAEAGSRPDPEAKHPR
ncbi:MAG TPA: hypothetical protein VMW31_04730 [Devosiaceae bacterium]|nr:hypothetical protein [Devosiaceae bacterium]